MGADFCYHVSPTGHHPSPALPSVKGREEKISSLMREDKRWVLILIIKFSLTGHHSSLALPSVKGREEKISSLMREDKRWVLIFVIMFPLRAVTPSPPTFLIREGYNLTFLNKKVNFVLKKYFI